MSDLCVVHVDTRIMIVGTKKECEAYRGEQPFNTDYWKINTLEDYGDVCYSDGYDNGYDAGFNCGGS